MLLYFTYTSLLLGRQFFSSYWIVSCDIPICRLNTLCFVLQEGPEMWIEPRTYYLAMSQSIYRLFHTTFIHTNGLLREVEDILALDSSFSGKLSLILLAHTINLLSLVLLIKLFPNYKHLIYRAWSFFLFPLKFGSHFTNHLYSTSKWDSLFIIVVSSLSRVCVSASQARRKNLAENLFSNI